jgi:hypothetical protein
MILRLTTLLIAVVLTSSMATAVHAYGAHSTPGLWLAIANFPGIAPGVWVSSLIGESPWLYLVCAAVNWAFYFYLVKVVLLMKRRFLS